MNTDCVLKRNGELEPFSFDKILIRVMKLGKTDLQINYTSLVEKISDRLYDGMPTSKIDELTAEQCASLITTHHHYGILASRILISNHQKNTSSSFLTVMEELYSFTDIHNTHHPLIAKDIYKLVTENSQIIEDMIDYERDYLIDFFGFKTLERAYLMRVNKIIKERPQHMWMRVALAIHFDNWEKVKLTYDNLSNKFFTHATPTLFNAGTPRPQLSSCYLLSMKKDSIDGIYETLTDCAKISKWAGGIGLHIHNIRAAGSHIRGTNGTSNGIVPMLRVYNNTARYVDQGGGKRNGSFAIYLEPWHGDIFDFLEMKKTHGDEEARARDLFYALWIPDLFMERVSTGGHWTLMCPDKCKGLSDVYGDKFKTLYEKYEAEGKGKKIQARDLWFKILDSQIETGTPYMLYKDACNSKSNQKNLGTIKSSNLCTEIIEYSNEEETAVCNLASIGLSKFVVNAVPSFTEKLRLYSKENCMYCKMSKNLLNQLNISFEEIIINNDDERMKIYRKFSEQSGKSINTVPIITHNDIYIGGYKELANLLQPTFDYKKLHKITKMVTENLDKVIDINYYPTDKTRLSNLRHRPIGIGVQGLADTFALMNIPFHSVEARDINKKIFETIYHASLEKSNEIAKERKESMMLLRKTYKLWRTEGWDDKQNLRLYKKIGHPNNKYVEEINRALIKYQPIPDEIKKLKDNCCGSYSSFVGSPTSEGLLQFDLWKVSPSDRYDWETLRNNIKNHGIRNSLLVAPMPTASTSQILGNNECFEPFTSNIYVRRTIAGEFIVANKYLMEELIQLDLWDEEMKNSIIANQGSIQHLKNIPSHIREKYKIVWEIPMKHILTMSKERGIFIDQSQSQNLWMKDPTYDKLTAMHFYAYRCGLKTGIYYLRTKAKAAPQQFTIDPSVKPAAQSLDEGCEMCSG
jgi:ribonucleoside-diphosphate reductase alpha subunit